MSHYDFGDGSEQVTFNAYSEFQWLGWEVQLSLKKHGRTALLTFTKSQTGENPFSLQSLLTSRPPVEAIAISLSSNPARAGPARKIVITDPIRF